MAVPAPLQERSAVVLRVAKPLGEGLPDAEDTPDVQAEADWENCARALCVGAGDAEMEGGALVDGGGGRVAEPKAVPLGTAECEGVAEGSGEKVAVLHGGAVVVYPALQLCKAVLLGGADALREGGREATPERESLSEGVSLSAALSVGCARLAERGAEPVAVPAAEMEGGAEPLAPTMEGETDADGETVGSGLLLRVPASRPPPLKVAVGEKEGRGDVDGAAPLAEGEPVGDAEAAGEAEALLEGGFGVGVGSIVERGVAEAASAGLFVGRPLSVGIAAVCVGAAVLVSPAVGTAVEVKSSEAEALRAVDEGSKLPRGVSLGVEVAAQSVAVAEPGEGGAV